MGPVTLAVNNSDRPVPLQKTYTRAFDRGMVSKEALYQLQQSIDDCADDKLWHVTLTCVLSVKGVDSAVIGCS